MSMKRDALGWTGRLMELDLLYKEGDPRKRAVDGIRPEDIHYQPLRDAITYCLTQNPNRYRDENDETWEPHAPWIADVQYYLAEELELEDHRQLKVFPALRTSADQHHGIDFFFLYEDPSMGKRVIVTVDISLNRMKKNGFKADVLISDTTVLANPEFYYGEAAVPDVYKGASKREEEMREEEMRKAIASVIASVIRQKLLEGDKHYPGLITRLRLQKLFGGGAALT